MRHQRGVRLVVEERRLHELLLIRAYGDEHGDAVLERIRCAALDAREAVSARDERGPAGGADGVQTGHPPRSSSRSFAPTMNS